VAERPGSDCVGKLHRGRPRCGRRRRLGLDGVWTRGGVSSGCASPAMPSSLRRHAAPPPLSLQRWRSRDAEAEEPRGGSGGSFLTVSARRASAALPVTAEEPRGGRSMMDGGCVRFAYACWRTCTVREIANAVHERQRSICLQFLHYIVGVSLIGSQQP
jgi:hypothetical protein